MSTGDHDRFSIAVGDEATRRAAVRRGLGAVVAAGLVPALLSPHEALAAAPKSDAAILAAAIRLENTAAAAYAAVAGNGALTPQLRRSATLFAHQEAEHAAALASALRVLGVTPPAGPDAKLLAPLHRARTQKQVVTFVVGLENMIVAAYHDAFKHLRQAAVLQRIAQIVANEGQHLVVLRQTLGGDPAPNAFETGRTSS